jgi:hypothetical protein
MTSYNNMGAAASSNGYGATVGAGASAAAALVTQPATQPASPSGSYGSYFPSAAAAQEAHHHHRHQSSPVVAAAPLQPMPYGTLELQHFLHQAQVQVQAQMQAQAQAQQQQQQHQVMSYGAHQLLSQMCSGAVNAENTTVTVQNIPAHVDTNWLRAMVEPFGQVLAVEMAHHPRTMRPLGHALVRFALPQQAQHCIGQRRTQHKLEETRQRASGAAEQERTACVVVFAHLFLSFSLCVSLFPVCSCSPQFRCGQESPDRAVLPLLEKKKARCAEQHGSVSRGSRTTFDFLLHSLPFYPASSFSPLPVGSRLAALPPSPSVPLLRFFKFCCAPPTPSPPPASYDGTVSAR